ncbi:MAG: DUF309 domain-containing protein [Gammaproteobacteria bacterium]|nr:DUF309 domain-containing protein [Gammaproteobacteria bacterium]
MTNSPEFITQWPTHAYVPGQSERHPEHAFDELTSSVNTTLSVEELSQSMAFRHGLIYLDGGYYWEAHEVFEPIWLVLPNDSLERLFVQGLIQLSNAHLKFKMDRPKASLRLCQMARELITQAEHTTIMGVNRASILQQINELEIRINI